jgi:hypothetical protein
MKEHVEVANFGNSNIELNVEECVQVISHGEDNFHIWHKQLGYLNVKDIKLLAQYNLVEGLLLKNEGICCHFVKDACLGSNIKNLS